MPDSLTIDGRTYEFDLSSPIDISIPLKFNGPQPNAYGVAPATSTPCSTDDLVGDTRRGGSCNFEQYTLIPHCNGTHTECVGHITHERISVRECLREAFIPATLITVDPVKIGETDEPYPATTDETDRLITRASLQAMLSQRPEKRAGLIVRTRANDERKLTRQYLEPVPPYFTTKAMEYIAEREVRHLVVDLPSIDRMLDAGLLSNHRIFWNVRQGSFETTSASRPECTITELAYVPNIVEDGSYLLNLQIAPFESDASPSRPLLFRLARN